MTSPHRWLVKKAARRAVASGSSLLRLAAAPLRDGAPRVRALTYHRFGQAERDAWCVSAEDFEAQVRWIGEQRLAVSLEQVARFCRGDGELADGSVLVTIDDGFRSTLEIAAPILRRYGVPAVAFVTTGAIASRGADAAEAFLDWDELRALAAAGVAIGSHGHTHRSMASLPLDEMRDEARRSKDLIERCLGSEAGSFAYPYGMRRDESPQTARVLAECGYRSVFISQHGAIRPRSDPLRLPRIKVEGGEPLSMFRQLCRGAMDVWRFADRLR